MKVLRFSLLTALLSTTAAFAAPIPADLAGSYQGLLYTGNEASGSPAGLIAMTLSSKGAVSGKLTTEENKTYSFKSALDYTVDSDEETPEIGTAAPLNAISIPRGKGLTPLSLTLIIKDISESEKTLEATLTEEEALDRVTTTGFKVKTYAKGDQPNASAGAYSLALSPADEPGEGEPSGSGFAAVTIDAKGLLKMKGKTADGIAFTAALPASSDYRYVAFLNPYKRSNSFLAGKIQLTEAAEDVFHMSPAESGFDFQWKKASLLPKTTDKSYREGFGPIDLLVTMESWTLPGKGQNLAQVLGAENFQFDFDLFGADLDLVNKYLGMIPKKLTVDAKGNLVPVYGDAFAPSDLKEWAKIWTGKVDPKTGIYTGTLTLSDLVDLDGEETNIPIKFINRKLSIAGILFNVDNPEIPLAFGHFILPPVNPKTELIKAGGFEFGGIFEALGLGAPDSGEIPAGTAGNYTSVLNKALEYDFSNFPGGGGIGIDVTGTFKGIPDNGASVNFSIAPNLSYIVFNGRKVPLIGNSLPVALVFSDATSKNYKNTLTVTVYINTTTGLVTGWSANYVQLLKARYTIGGRTVSSYVPGVATCINSGSPVKVP